jgi:hypothetical protein
MVKLIIYILCMQDQAAMLNFGPKTEAENAAFNKFFSNNCLQFQNIKVQEQLYQ